MSACTVEVKNELTIEGSGVPRGGVWGVQTPLPKF